MERPQPLPKKKCSPKEFIEQHTEVSCIFKHINTRTILVSFFLFTPNQEIFTYFFSLNPAFSLLVYIYNISDDIMHEQNEIDIAATGLLLDLHEEISLRQI